MKHKKLATFSSCGILSILSIYTLEKRILTSIFHRDERYNTKLLPHKKYENQWFDKMEKEKIQIHSFDQILLTAYLLHQPTNTNRFILLLHGFHGDIHQLTYEAKHFYEQGFHVLIPYLRAHNQSGGNAITMGILEKKDVSSWIHYLLNTYDQPNICIYGISMGASTMLLALPEIQEYICCCISDCAYSKAIGMFDYYLKQRVHFPYQWYLKRISQFFQQKTKQSILDAAPIHNVNKIKIPILYIHGDKDEIVPYQMMEDLYLLTPANKQKLTIPNAKHILCSSQDSKTYWKVVDQFLSTYIK